MLSVLVPLYNEEEFVGALLERVLAAPLPRQMAKEIIVVDDGSNDGSAEVVERFAARHSGCVKLVRHETNRGKGAAVRTALEHARGEFCIIQDADLEYDPRDYPRLLHPLLEGKADAVYGSRFLVAGERRVLYFWHALANNLLTTFCNIAADLNLTDIETCYKAFRTSLLKSIPLRSDRFGIEPELTIKLARRQARIYETPINYHGRTYEEGKKISFADAVAAFFVIARYAFTSDLYNDPGQKILDSFACASRFNRWMADTISPYLGRNILEIGAGIGNLTRHLISRRERYIAADIDQEHLARLRARLHHRPNLQTLPCDLSRPDDFRDLAGSVDTVVCLNVLEHVDDELRALANIRMALCDGGRAVILVPEGPGIYNELDAALGHSRRYTEEHFRKCLRTSGFRVEQMIPFNRISRPGWYLNGSVLRRRTISPGQLRTFDRLVWLWKRIDNYLPWPPTSLIAVAVKEDPAVERPATSAGN
ncbi:MAG: glycosyltransferase [Bryobacteraceae bacterium]|nr:glycosyltransferase [Bryobacteraceae bacterium]